MLNHSSYPIHLHHWHDAISAAALKPLSGIWQQGYYLAKVTRVLYRASSTPEVQTALIPHADGDLLCCNFGVLLPGAIFCGSLSSCNFLFSHWMIVKHLVSGYFNQFFVQLSTLWVSHQFRAMSTPLIKEHLRFTMMKRTFYKIDPHQILKPSEATILQP